MSHTQKYLFFFTFFYSLGNFKISSQDKRLLNPISDQLKPNDLTLNVQIISLLLHQIEATLDQYFILANIFQGIQMTCHVFALHHSITKDFLKMSNLQDCRLQLCIFEGVSSS